jgi:hypothetical protein
MFEKLEPHVPSVKQISLPSPIKPVPPPEADVSKLVNSTLRDKLIAAGIIVERPVKPPSFHPTPARDREEARRRQTVFCPLCNERLYSRDDLKEELFIHLEVDHPFPSKSEKKNKKLKRKQHKQKRDKKFETAVQVTKVKDTTEDKSKLVWQPVDLMDANRGMGAFARENGRFGSHALHDRFDDESTP